MLPDYRNQKVPIVEDVPAFRFSLQGMVQQLGAQDIDMAANGKLALEKVNRAISIKDYKKAIREGNLLIESGSKYTMLRKTMKKHNKSFQKLEYNIANEK